MNKFYLVLFSVVFSLGLSAQTCADQWKEVFKKRGAYAVADDIHRNVIIALWEGEDVYCLQGKCRVENGRVKALWIMLEDEQFDLIDKKLLNSKKEAPLITGGYSELFYSPEAEKYQVFFKEKIKPKKKGYKQVGGPGDEFK
jgi:hypothetical protein